MPTTKLNQEMIDLIERYKITAYGFFGFSTTLWDQFNNNIAKLRKGTRILKGGLLLSNNYYMVQGDYIAIPLTSNIGYQNQSHIIIHFFGAEPDLGRKGFQPELKEIAEIIAIGIVNRLKKWKKKLKKDTGVTPSIAPQINLHNWIREQEKYEEKYPLKLNNPHFFKLENFLIF